MPVWEVTQEAGGGLLSDGNSTHRPHFVTTTISFCTISSIVFSPPLMSLHLAYPFGTRATTTRIPTVIWRMTTSLTNRTTIISIGTVRPRDSNPNSPHARITTV